MRVLALAVLLAACASPVDRPVHPLRLEGFPGAPFRVEMDWLRAGARWEFDGDGKKLELALEREGDDLVLKGGRRGGAIVRMREGYLEVSFEGKVVDRLLKSEGEVGDRWRVGKARYTVFGFDTVHVLGADRQALVVAAERGQVRDLYWFASDLGFVRLRTEVQGKAKRDATLTAYVAGGAN